MTAAGPWTRPAPGETGTLTLEQGLAEFLTHLGLEKNASDKTVKSYREDLTQALVFARELLKKEGVLAGSSRRLAERLLAELQGAAPGVVMALDEPYRVAIDEDYAIPVHGDARGHDALLIEVRNDELGGAETVAVWADRLAEALARI